MPNDHEDKLFAAHNELQKNHQQIEGLKKKVQDLEKKLYAKNTAKTSAPGPSTPPQTQSTLDKLLHSVTELNKKMDDFKRIETKVTSMEDQLSQNTKKLDVVVEKLKGLSNIQAGLNSLVMMGGTKKLSPSGGPKVLVLGGEWPREASSSRPNISNEMFLMDLDSKKVEEMPLKLPYRASLMGAVFFQRTLYIFGGRDPDGKSVCHLYSLSKQQNWIKKRDMHERRSQIGGSSVELEGMLYVVGGSRDGCPLRSVEKYNSVKDQ